MTTYTDPGAIADVVGTSGRIEATWGNAINSRVVHRFASTAARDAAITAPTEGVLCYVTVDNLYYHYDGAAWNPIGPWGAWTTYNIGTGVVQGGVVTFTQTYSAWIRHGRMVTWSWDLSVTGGAGLTNQPIRIVFPFAPVAANCGYGTGEVFNNSGSAFHPCLTNVSDTTAVQYRDATQTTAVALGQTGSSFNEALASGDVLRGTITYEAAS